MSSVLWYWHRLRAMSPTELANHGRRKIHQVSDRYLARLRFAGFPALGPGSTFPALPDPQDAPESLRLALRRDAEAILQGRWIAFGHLELQVEDPPRWHKDYLANADLTTSKPALKLHHRLEGKADIKLLWEPNRWYSLVRLAQAAYILQDRAAAVACVRWLQDWVDKNPPYFGWNWTSGLETGLRLIQFVWIDALLSGMNRNAAAQPATPLGSVTSPPEDDPLAGLNLLRTRILRPHLWFTWRDRSFGSSANNHLIGELSGLILALVRWPALSSWGAPLETLQRLWEEQVLTQFATDGGNREQALNYHLFSWEFCWQARLALRAAGRSISPEVEERLRAAVGFFRAIQVERGAWDYGDSDSAFVTPLFTEWPNATAEWHRWFTQTSESAVIGFWLGKPPEPLQPVNVLTVAKHWKVYPDTGYAVARVSDWFLRWDLSPLGYLATAGHGHCDALHLSVWYRGQPVIVDPGTGAYHANRPLRDYLASWDAHNGPHPHPARFPERRGAFLWSARHQTPKWKKQSESSLSGELELPNGRMRRVITRLEAENAWLLEDGFYPSAPGSKVETEVFWQFAPSVLLEHVDASRFDLRLDGASVRLELGPEWTNIEMSRAPSDGSGVDPAKSLRGACSSAFRRVEQGPFLLLRGQVNPNSALRTTLRVN